MNEPIRVAVYGSLKSGFGLHNTLKRWDSKLLGTDRLSYYLMFDLNAFPAVVPSTNMADSISVEVYEISKECLSVLDGVEGVDAFFYERVKVETRLGDAWMYQYHPESTAVRLNQLNAGRIVQSGTWTKSPVTTLWSAAAIMAGMDATYRARVEACQQSRGIPSPARTNIVPFRQAGVAALAPPAPPPVPKEVQFDLGINYVEEATNVDVSDPAI